MSQTLEFLVQRSYLDQSSDIAPRSYGNRDMRDLHAKNVIGVLLNAHAIDFFHAGPFHQCDGEVDFLFSAYAGNPKHGGYVNDPNTAYFHVVPRGFG